MNTAIEERIRKRAYELWEAEGRPEGREIDHWLQAVHEVAADGKTAAPRARAPRKAAASVATAPAPKTKSTKGVATGTATAARKKVAPKSS